MNKTNTLKPFHESIIDSINSCINKIYGNDKIGDFCISPIIILFRDLKTLNDLIKITQIPKDKIPNLVSSLEGIATETIKHFETWGETTVNKARLHSLFFDAGGIFSSVRLSLLD